MKKLLFLLVGLTNFLQAEEIEAVCMSWHDSLIFQWNNLSHMHKLLVTALVGLTVLWIVWRIVKCGKGGCGCHCNENCTCKL